MTGPPLALGDLYRAYQAEQGAAAGTPRLRVPAAPRDATPSLAQLHAAYLAQQNTETGAQHAAGAARAFGQGATFGFGDEIEAGLRSMTPGPVPINVPAYVNTRDQIRDAQHTYEGRHPLEAAGLETAGALATAAVPVGGAARAATGLGRVGRAMAVGTGMGAAYGLGKGEGDLASQAKSTVEGAGYGAAGGLAFQSLGEGARTAARAVDASPRVADLLAKVAPADAVKRWAAGVTDRATARDVVERLAQDQTTPGQAAQRLADTPEHIPLAIVDAGGENAREAVGAVKRLPGPEKNAIATRLRARDSNAPEALRRTVREATDNQAAALGLDPTKIDTRTANPNTVERAAREALRARDEARYGPLLQQATTYDDATAGKLGKLLKRPSMGPAKGYAGALAGEDDRVLGALKVGAPESTTPAAGGLVDATGQPLTRPTAATAATGPSAQDLHYLQMGHARHVGELKAQVEELRRNGADVGKVATQLQKATKTHKQLLKVIDDVVPGYGDVRAAHAGEIAPITAFVKGRALPVGADADEVATRFADQPNDNARQGLGAGVTRRIGADLRRSGDARANPAKAVIGSGDPTDNKVQNLRLLVPKAAPVIEQAADAVDRMRQTSQRVLGGSPTTERAIMNASLAHKAGALVKLVGGKPLAAAKDILGGTYGPQAQRTAEKLLLGAGPGERDAAVAYLRGLETARTTPSGAAQLPRLRSRGVGTVAGNAGGTTAAIRNRP